MTNNDTTHAAAPESGREVLDAGRQRVGQAIVSEFWSHTRGKLTTAEFDAAADRIIDAALAASPAGAGTVGGEAFGRFDHHPEPAIDFCIEVEVIEGLLYDRKVGASAGQGLAERIARAMTFRVGGDEIAVRAKGTLRKMEAELTALTAPPAAAETVAEERPNRRDIAPLKWNPALGSLHGHKLGDRVVALGKGTTGIGTLEDIDATGGCNIGKIRFDQGGCEWVRFSRFDHIRPALATHRQSAQAGAGDGLAVDVWVMETTRGPDFFVRLQCGDRWCTPHVFRERFKAEYEVARLQWVLGLRPDEPDLMAYDETTHPNDPAAPIETGNGEASV